MRARKNNPRQTSIFLHRKRQKTGTVRRCDIVARNRFVREHHADGPSKVNENISSLKTLHNTITICPSRPRHSFKIESRSDSRSFCRMTCFAVCAAIRPKSSCDSKTKANSSPTPMSFFTFFASSKVMWRSGLNRGSFCSSLSLSSAAISSFLRPPEALRSPQRTEPYFHPPRFLSLKNQLARFCQVPSHHFPALAVFFLYAAAISDSITSKTLSGSNPFSSATCLSAFVSSFMLSICFKKGRFQAVHKSSFEYTAFEVYVKCFCSDGGCRSPLLSRLSQPGGSSTPFPHRPNSDAELRTSGKP